MLAKRVIPCLDVKDGRVVKGVRFVNLQDAGDPVKNAEFYSKEGADELVYLDITASSEKRGIIINVVEKTAENVFMPLTVGGGIRTVEDIHRLLLAGADKVSINTAAVEDTGLVERAAGRFGRQCIVVAIDAKRKGNSWEVYTHGGRTKTGKDAVGWAKTAESAGAGEILLTSMDSDGTRSGYDIGLTRQISEAVNIPVIASGGAGSPSDMYEVLSLGRADAVLAASIFHYREYSIRETKEYLSGKGIPIRR